MLLIVEMQVELVGALAGIGEIGIDALHHLAERALVAGVQPDIADAEGAGVQDTPPAPEPAPAMPDSRGSW